MSVAETLPMVDIVEVKRDGMVGARLERICNDLLPALDTEQCEWDLNGLLNGWIDGDVDVAEIYVEGRRAGTICGRVEKLADESFALVVLAAGGERGPEWFGPMVEFGKHHAAKRGATKFLFKGRPGWTRRLRDLGFRPMYTAYVCELGGEE